MLGSVIGGGIGRRLLVPWSGIRPPTISGAPVRPGTGVGFISRLLTADARVGMIADTAGRKEGAKVGNTIGVAGRPGRNAVGTITGSAVTTIVVMKDATRNSKVTDILEPSSEKREWSDMILLDLVVGSSFRSNKAIGRESFSNPLIYTCGLVAKEFV